MDHSNKTYLIQGLFYMERDSMHIGQKPDVGSAVYVTRNLYHVLFSGVLVPDAYIPEGPILGAMQDQFGTSDLTRITFTDELLEFTKIYEGRSDTIQYLFKQKLGELWIGTWKGRLTGSGFAKCMVTPVDADYYEPYPVAEALGIKLL